METFNLMVWIFFMGAVFFLSFFAIKKINQNKREKRENEAKILEFRLENEILTSEKFDKLKIEELYQAVVFSVMKKEEDDEDFFDHLTRGEKVVYGIYQLNSSISSTTGLRSFFLSPASEQFGHEIDTYFDELGAVQIADLLRSAKKFNDVLESGNQSDEEIGEYATYNFSDYTHEYVTLIAGTNFDEKLNLYIKNNKEMFVVKGE